MALAKIRLVCAAGEQSHHPRVPISVEARTLRKARRIAWQRLGWRFRRGAAWCRDCWALGLR